MSREGKDRTYKPKRKKCRRPTRESTRIKQRQAVDYTEVDTVDLDSSEDLTILYSELGCVSDQAFKREQSLKGDSTDGFMDREVAGEDWTSKTLRITANKVSQQVIRLSQLNRDLTMAREVENTSVERLMEMIISMRADEQNRERQRATKARTRR